MHNKLGDCQCPPASIALALYTATDIMLVLHRKPYLFAQDFDLILCELFALIQLFYPSVQLLGEGFVVHA